MTRFAFADVAAIMAAAEKDSQYIQDLNQRLTRLVSYFAGPQNRVKYLSAIGKLSATLYYTLTWLSDSKTLGEEYAQLEPVDVFSKTSPSRFIRIVYILYQVHIVPLLPKPVKALIFPFHLLLFYKNGQYFDVVKRVLGIRMVGTNTKSLRAVHYCLLLFTLLNTLFDLRDYISDKMTITNRSTLDCSLCKDKMSVPTVCPCGHVYCWQCITLWIQRLPSCPLCRQECKVNHLYSIAI